MADIWFRSLTEQRDLLRRGELSARELTALYLERIQRFDPRLNAFRTVWAERAMADAATADERRAAGEDAPLLGLPLAIKEDLEVAGEPPATGTRAVHTPSAADSEALRRLRQAGAIILGRTRMPELGLFPFTTSERFGDTRNPWSAQHSPGGSSGGSAAAVSGGLAAAAMGSDGSGSIRIPAACCNLFGLKPQTGRISLHPTLERWTGMVAIGPLTRSVRDWAVLGDQLRDTQQLPAPPTSFEEAATTTPGKLRIALSVRPMGLAVKVDPQVEAAARSTADLLAALGHEIVERDPRLADPTGAFAHVPRYLGSAAREVAKIEEPGALDRRTRDVARYGRLIPDALYERSIRFGSQVTAAANEIFQDVDVLLTPTLAAPVARLDFWRGKGTFPALLAASRYVGFLHLWNLAGNPAASVPAGFDTDGVPIGIQLVGRQNDECTLLSLAAQLEQARPWTERHPELA
ncbi:amidase [Pseudonocardiaceae bacterium YIM PH 21723]|nr:amidase [Pseudonocardiaceae bacterium YIM PH 21723]